MTAEVCVMNKLGVALAADSAITRTSRTDSKIYQSADKLFLLSHSDPVAVMIYGSASFMQMPWETVIKLYREEHGHRSRKTVLDHARGLMNFLAKSRELFPEDLQRAHVRSDVIAFLAQLLKTLNQPLGDKLAAQNEINAAEVRASIAALVKSELDDWQRIPLPEGLPRTHVATVRRQFGQDISRGVDRIWGKMPMSKVVRERLKTLACLVLTKYLMPDHSGVVFAGFGNAEIFPAVVEVTADRVLANRTKYRKTKDVRIGHGNNATIAPFAQKEMVHMFMEGIDPGLDNFIQRSLSRTFEDLPRKLVDTLGGGATSRQSLLNTLGELSGNAVATLKKDWAKYRRENHVNPIIRIVSMLPKAELASLAESLVNLTVLRRHTSTQAETVGGPIDVAAVTKGDGFVWIKRKHYFDAALNPRYIAGMGGGQKQWPGKKPSSRSKKS